jgi:hypothetical protein
MFIQESRRRGGYSVGNVSNSDDMGVLSMHSSWSPIRPKSASHHREIEIVKFFQEKKNKSLNIRLKSNR